MIIIDQVADSKLASALEKMKADDENARCIYFNLKNKPTVLGTVEKVIKAAGEHAISINTQIYLCEDGDIFILAPIISTKAGKELILDIANHMKIPADESWAIFGEIPLHVNKLLAVVEEKLERRRTIEENGKKIRQQQAAHQLAEQKRKAILNGAAHSNAVDIAQHRQSRTTADIMIIEDDAFSRRLVENVLQKEYRLTALGEADKALSTYARIAPDILFLDINLPDVTGHELLEKIVACDPDAYVVMLSGNSDKDNIMQAMSKGAKGFIAKPFTKDKLFQYIERCPTITHKQPH